MTLIAPRIGLFYALVALAGVWTHYYYGLLILSGVLIGLVERRSWREFRKPVLCHAVLGVAMFPLLLVLPADLAASQSAPTRVVPNLAAAGYALFVFVGGHAIGPSIRELHTMDVRQAVLGALPWVLVIAFVLSVLGSFGLRVLAVRAPRWRPRLFLLTAIPLAGGLAAASAAGVTFQVRHVVWAAAPLLVMLSVGLAESVRSRAAAAATVVLGLLTPITIYNRNNTARYRNENVAALGTYLRAHSAPGAEVFVTPPYMLALVRFYAGPDRLVLPLPSSSVQTSDPDAALQFLRDRAGTGRPFWVVYTRPFHADRDGLLLAGIDSLGGRWDDTAFAGIRLFSYDRATTTATRAPAVVP